MKVLTKIAMWGLLVTASGTALNAEPAGGWLSPNGTSGNIGISAGVSDSNRINGNLSAQSVAEMMIRVHQLQEQTRTDARHVQHLQQIARHEKDIIKLNCVNDKLVQIKPQMNMADTAANELSGATEYTKVSAFQTATLAAENVRRLREEADQCIGEPVQSGWESSNSFTGPTPPDDPMRGQPGGGLEPPVYASPYN